LSQQDGVLVDYILPLGVLFLIPYLELTLFYSPIWYDMNMKTGEAMLSLCRSSSSAQVVAF